MFKNLLGALGGEHSKINRLVADVFDKLPMRNNKRPYTLGKTWERPDAYVWLINSEPDVPDSGGIETNVPQKINNKLALGEYRHRAQVLQNPLRVEIKKPEPDSVPMANEWANIARLETNRCAFVAGMGYTLYKSEIMAMSLENESTAHLLIAGTTGSGKTVAGMGVLTTLAMLNSPEYLGLIIIDPKRVDIESSAIADLPHLINPVISNIDQAIKMLRLVVREMERRSGEMDQLRKQRRGYVIQNHIVVYVEEVADLVDRDASIVDDLTRIAQLGRGLGIHLILLTQRPTTDIITGRLKANLPGKIVLRVDSQNEGYIASGRAETLAHTLPGKGTAYLFYGGNPDAAGTFMRCLYLHKDKRMGEWPDVDRFVNDIQRRWHGCQPAVRLALANNAPAVESVKRAESPTVDSAAPTVETPADRVLEACLAAAKDIADAQQFNMTFTLNAIDAIAKKATGEGVGRGRAKKIKAELASALGFGGHGVWQGA